MLDCWTAEAGRKVELKKKNSPSSPQKGFFFSINHVSLWGRVQTNLSWMHNLGRTQLKGWEVESIRDTFSKCLFCARWGQRSCRQRADARRGGGRRAPVWGLTLPLSTLVPSTSISEALIPGIESLTYIFLSSSDWIRPLAPGERKLRGLLVKGINKWMSDEWMNEWGDDRMNESGLDC